MAILRFTDSWCQENNMPLGYFEVITYDDSDEPFSRCLPCFLYPENVPFMAEGI